MSNTDTPAKPSGPWLSNKAYDFLKFLAQIALPAVATLYFAVAGIWGLPDAQAVVATIVAVDTFLGVVLGISNAQYMAVETPYDGQLNVTQEPDGTKTFQLHFTDHPNEYGDDKSELKFKVVNALPAEDATPGVLPQVPPAG